MDMDVYLYASYTIFFLKNGQSINTFQPTKELGIYEDKPVKSRVKSPMTKVKDVGKSIVNHQQVKDENLVAQKDTLKYKSYHQKETHFFVGCSEL